MTITEEIRGETLTETDRDELLTYLNKGGKLFLTGQDIGYDIGASDFYENYLHVNFEKNDFDECNTNGDILGLSGDPISDGLTGNVYGGAENQYYPSIVSSSDSVSQPFFEYEYRTKYVGWGFCKKDSDSY